jgi:hypothetical protein
MLAHPVEQRYSWWLAAKTVLLAVLQEEEEDEGRFAYLAVRLEEEAKEELVMDKEGS